MAVKSGPCSGEPALNEFGSKDDEFRFRPMDEAAETAWEVEEEESTALKEEACAE